MRCVVIGVCFPSILASDQVHGDAVHLQPLKAHAPMVHRSTSSVSHRPKFPSIICIQSAQVFAGDFKSI